MGGGAQSACANLKDLNLCNGLSDVTADDIITSHKTCVSTAKYQLFAKIWLNTENFTMNSFL